MKRLHIEYLGNESKSDTNKVWLSDAADEKEIKEFMPFLEKAMAGADGSFFFHQNGNLVFLSSQILKKCAVTIINR